MLKFFKRTLSLLNVEQGQILRNENFEEKIIKAMKDFEAKVDVVKQASKYVPRFKRKDDKRPTEVKNPAKEGAVPFVRIKRNKSIILLGYSGAKYFGMQRNPTMQTIEEELLVAMKKQNWITEEVFNQPQVIEFQRAARTDKGVSAWMQCVSLKLPEPVDIAAINRELPEAIKIFCVKRATKGFNSKDHCDFRTYSYTLPTVAFADHSNPIHPDMETFRLPTETLTKVNETLKLYEGTKNFHNFTTKKASFDPSACRYIVSMECGTPFLIRNMYEFATIKVKGSSFMLHQIRKMLGFMLAVVRGLVPMENLEKSFKEEKIDIPRAPGLGLALNQLHYDRYNNRFGDVRGKILFDEYKEQIEEFAQKYIISTIVETEIAERPMLEWVETLHKHTYEVREEDKGRTKDEDLDE